MKMKKLPVWCIALIIFALSLSAISWIPAGLKQENLNNTALASSVHSENEGGNKSAEALFNDYVNTIYATAGLDKASMNLDVFRKAVVGYLNFRHSGLVSSTKSLITIVDFNKPSREKRLWIVDLENKKLLYNTLVAHGQGTGDDMAKNFSNVENSHQSSLGFYITDETYTGKHGLSLKLDGMDEGFNTNARNRAVVVHGADYVSQSFVNQHGRLGRSHGCPALPADLTATIIKNIKGKTMLYIDGPSEKYNSRYLDQTLALQNFSKEINTLHASL